MDLNLKEIPFMRYGSYFAVSETASGEFVLRDVHGGDMSASELFQFRFFDPSTGKTVEQVQANATETAVVFSSLEDPTQQVRLCFPDSTDCLIEATGLGVELKAEKVRYDTFYQTGEDEYYFISYKKEMKYIIRTRNVQVEAPWEKVGNRFIQIKLTGENDISRFYLKEQKVEKQDRVKIPDWKAAQAALQKEFENWKKKMPEVPVSYNSSRDLASYILWGNVVHAEGCLTADITYMSKNHMQNIWSWDNCFSAMGIATSDPELAYNQLKVFIDHQAENGSYPDFINDLFASYSCVKPPIHAWAYREMAKKNSLFYEERKFRSIFLSIEKATQYWLTERLLDESGLPYYTHGNDSGWDNASVFLKGIPVASPDLTAYLIQQMDILTEFAQKLGEQEKAAYWKAEADELYGRLMEKMYNGDRFFARKLREPETVLSTSSLILCLPLVLSYRYPKEVTKKLVAQLENELEATYGLATEALDSPYYKEDGYWLGPIWAPVSYIVIDALYKAGYQEAGDRLAQKFCDMTLIGGMAENYNAETGNGNDDLAFAWSSSVFLLLGEKLAQSHQVNNETK